MKAPIPLWVTLIVAGLIVALGIGGAAFDIYSVMQDQSRFFSITGLIEIAIWISLSATFVWFLATGVFRKKKYGYGLAVLFWAGAAVFHVLDIIQGGPGPEGIQYIPQSEEEKVAGKVGSAMILSYMIYAVGFSPSVRKYFENSGDAATGKT